MIFLIVWESNFAQSLFVPIYWIVFKRYKWNLLVTTYFFFFIFFCTKIIWWSDNPISISPHCVIFWFAFVNTWLIRVNVLGVALVGDFINCLTPKVLQNSKYFFALHDTLFAPFLMFLFSSPHNEPLWCKFIFRSPRICYSSLSILSEFKLCDSISRNLVWSGGLKTVTSVIGFVFGIRSSSNIFSISFEIQFLLL